MRFLVGQFAIVLKEDMTGLEPFGVVFVENQYEDVDDGFWATWYESKSLFGNYKEEEDAASETGKRQQSFEFESVIIGFQALSKGMAGEIPSKI